MLGLGLGLAIEKGPLVPGWILPGSSIDFNFAQSLYYGTSLSAGISLSRASTGYAQTAAGVLVPFGSGVPRITDQGFLIEEARTNKCTNFNANPTDLTNVTKSGDAAAVLSVVDDTAALLAAGLQNIATSGKVYKLDNSLGVGIAQLNIAGTAGNTNPHSLSAYIRGGTGKMTMTTGGGSTFTASASYTRRTAAGVTPAAGSTAAISADAGQTLFVALNQFEEGAFVTSPIVTAGASATRAADVPQLIGPAATAALAAKSAFFQTNGGEGITSSLGYMLGDASNAAMFFNGTTTIQIRNDAAIATTPASLGTGSYAGTLKSAFGFDSSGMTARAGGGTQQTSATGWTFTAPFYLGVRSLGDRALNGYMQRFALSPVKGAFDGLTV